jgi:hypothetical protein
MPMLNINIAGYIAEVGDLDLGLPGGKRVRGITFEVGDGGVTITGLTKEQCKAAGCYLRSRVQITIQSSPESETEQHG